MKNLTNSTYFDEGDLALADGIRGPVNHRGGHWQGYEKMDFLTVIDLEKTIPVKRIKTVFLQQTRAQIFLPSSVDYDISYDGETFKKIVTLGHDVPTDSEKTIRKYFEKTLKNIQARYVRIRAKNIGVCPEGHYRAGRSAWLFVDEIIIE